MMQENTERANGTEEQNSYMRKFHHLSSCVLLLFHMLVSIPVHLSLPNEAMQLEREASCGGGVGEQEGVQ